MFKLTSAKLNKDTIDDKKKQDENEKLKQERLANQ
jgi:hypothetical protein